MCGSCGRARKSARSAPTTQLVGHDGFAEMKYGGNAVEGLYWGIVSGATYEFNVNRRVGLVDVRDVKYLKQIEEDGALVFAEADNGRT